MIPILTSIFLKGVGEYHQEIMNHSHNPKGPNMNVGECWGMLEVLNFSVLVKFG